MVPISLIILISTGAISLWGLYQNRNLISKWAFSPYEAFRGKKIENILLSGFVHANLSHLLFNLMSFYFFAFPFERQIGSAKFFFIYMISLIASDIPTLIKQKDNYYYRSIGASGAISAIVFGFIVLNPFSKMLAFPIPFPIPSFLYGILYVIYSYYASKQSDDGINHSAHLWGGVAGAILTIIL